MQTDEHICARLSASNPMAMTKKPVFCNHSKHTQAYISSCHIKGWRTKYCAKVLQIQRSSYKYLPEAEA